MMFTVRPSSSSLKGIIVFFLSLTISLTIQAQSGGVSINQDSSTAHPSAMLDVKSTDKGMLIPRMTTAQRGLISNPETGLLVFDTTTNGFWFFNGAIWEEVGTDNLGDHIATQNLQLNGNYLSGDGENEGILVDANGQVGVNTPSPLSTLHVTGNIQMEDGNQQSGYVMTSDDNGQASWQPTSNALFSELGEDFSCIARVGTFDSPDVYDVIYADSLAFLLGPGGMTIVDISNPFAPQFIKTVETLIGSNYVFDHQGNYVYVISTTRQDDPDGYFFTIDVSDPAGASIIDTLELNESSTLSSDLYWEYNSICVQGNYAYVLQPGQEQSDIGKIFTIDISNPDSAFTFKTSRLRFRLAKECHIYNNHLYVIGEELEVFSLSNPASPTRITEFPLPGFSIAEHIEVINNIACYVTINSFQVLNVSDPSNISFLGSLSFEDDAIRNFTIEGDFAYLLLRDSGLKIINLSQPSSPQIEKEFAFGYDGLGIDVSGNYAYVASVLIDRLSVLELGCNTALTFNSVTGEIGTTGAPVTYQVGDFAQGGVIFWVDETGQHGLVCAKTDQSSDIRWYAGTFGNTRARGDGIYAGAMNTTTILSSQIAIGDDGNDYAAQICADLQIAEGAVTYGDWYLPSKEELNLIFQNRTVISQTATNNGGTALSSNTYWSSSEFDGNRSWGQTFSSGNQSDIFKSSVQCVRAIRAF